MGQIHDHRVVWCCCSYRNRWLGVGVGVSGPSRLASSLEEVGALHLKVGEVFLFFLSIFFFFLNVMQSKFKDHIAVFLSASQLYYPSLILFNIDFRRNNRRFHLLPMASKTDDAKSKQTWADQATAE